MTLGSSASVFAQTNINTLQPNAPIISINDKLLRGSSKPGKYASIHDLSISKYNYQVEEVGAAVYTDKWLTGVSNIGVSVDNWTQTTSQLGSTNKLTITVYNNKGKSVATSTLSMSSSSNVTSFSGLSTTEKYYVQFSVPITGHKFSFNGEIYEN